MTDCHTVQQSFDDLRAGTIRPGQAAHVRRHLQRCAACRAFYQDVSHLRSALAEPVPPLPRRLSERVKRRYRLPQRVAVAAMLLLLVGGFVLRTDLVGVAQSPSFVEDWTRKTIDLALDSEKALPGVHIRLELPLGVEVEGRPGERVLAWQDDLDAGANRLSIPLMLEQGAKGELVASVEHDGRRREFRIGLGEEAR
ncbi:hypothetical protein CAI21_14565 [Alkalilimnicola ehrlichii]|uniref:Zinc-finger domain-containing protein n=1 Tax=Alkalilimnicola ehrlichii TaxID=351052 RepID=A0A3E0WQW0_9GAMM|nr:hypothetical protein [Alkalilimnicola ehrlichii]RFA27264.1 hypothetical protein CAI21_14565 [Alkalilimnicola ehrlichii]RFA34376.1 hypothetical protein CAL65_15130 [Alkalilimnicola ehrlichii]